MSASNKDSTCILNNLIRSKLLQVLHCFSSGFCTHSTRGDAACRPTTTHIPQRTDKRPTPAKGPARPNNSPHTLTPSPNPVSAATTVTRAPAAPQHRLLQEYCWCCQHVLCSCCWWTRGLLEPPTWCSQHWAPTPIPLQAWVRSELCPPHG